MKKYVLLIPIICLVQSLFAQTDTFYYDRFKMACQKPKAKSMLIIDNNIFYKTITHTWQNVEGLVTRKVLFVKSAVGRDSLTEWVHSEKTGTLLYYSTSLPISDDANDDAETTNSSRSYYREASELYKMERLNIELIINYATKYVLEDVFENVYNNRGKVIGQNKVQNLRAIKVGYLDINIKNRDLLFFVGDNRDTIIRNGQGKFSGYSYSISEYSQTFEDTFKVSGMIADGKLVGEWIGTRLNGQKYFTENFDKGKFINGISYDSEGNTYKYDQVYQNCIFGSCEKDLMDFISTNVKYPDYEKEADIQGRTLTRFMIDKTGHVDNVESLTNISAGLEKEARRVVSAMNRWEPAVLRGQKISVYYNLPINYQLQ